MKPSSFSHSKKYLSSPLTFPLSILTYVIILGIVFIIFKYVHVRPPSIVDNKHTEMTTLPQHLNNRIRSASLSASLRIPILMYHYVEYVQDKRDTIRQSLTIPPNIFESQVITLKDAGYTFLTASDVADILDEKAEIPDKPILLTFDDGHWDFATDVLPILKKYQVKATQYVVSGFTGGSDSMNHQQLQDVIDSNLVEIGAHTVHHTSLKGLNAKILTYEITKSKEMLEDGYHLHIVSFAYPNGSFDEAAESEVKKAGFRTSVSTLPGIEQSNENRYFLYRLRPGLRTGELLLTWLNQSTFKAYR